MEKPSEETKKYKLVPPEGGWGYMICVSFIINVASVTMFIGCFGLLYNDFMLEIGMNSTNVTLLTGMHALCFATGGFLANSILKIMSLRKQCLLAVLTYDLGAFGMYFASSQPVFFICQGVFMGTGMGITYNLSCTILNDYFVKRRMFAYSLGYFVSALIGMMAPMCVKWSLQEFGFRGTVLLVAGVMMHNIFGVALMQPVKMHMKRVEVLPNEEMQLLVVDDKSNIVKSTDEEKATELPENNANEIIIDDGKKSALWRVLEAFIDIDFAKKFVLSCACMGPAVTVFADSTFSLIMPQALYALEWSQDKVALAISIFAFGDLAMRTLFIFTGSCIARIGSQEFYVIGIILAFVSRLGMLWSENEIAIYFYISIMGAARCCIMVLITVVTSDVVPSDKFTEAIGIGMLSCGIIVLVLGPAIGAIRDLTNSYNTAFYILTSCLAIVALFWSIELCYKKNKEKRKIQKENLEKIKTSQLNKGK